jgi:hypothetical protein
MWLEHSNIQDQMPSCYSKKMLLSGLNLTNAKDQCQQQLGSSGHYGKWSVIRD